MGKLVNAEKWCIGKPLLDRPALTAPDRWQLVGLTALDGAQMPRAAKIVADPDHAAPNPMLGHVTSWCFSPNLDAWIALALLSSGRERHGETLWAVSPLANAKVRVQVGSPCSSILKASGCVSDPITLTEVPIARGLECARRCVARGFRRSSGATVLDRTAYRAEHNSAQRCANGILALAGAHGCWSQSRPAHRSLNLTKKRDAMNTAGGALFDLTAISYRVSHCGLTTQPIYSATGCPLDLHPCIPRRRLCAKLFGRVNALLYKSDDAPTFLIMFARSFARDARQALRFSAAQYGYPGL